MENEKDIVKAAQIISRALDRLGNGDAASSMGAIENHAVLLSKGMESIAEAINNLADAIRG